MQKEVHVFQGMGRDKHPTAQPATILWEAKNIRINRRDGDNFLSVTNEKGNVDTNIFFMGDYVGHCVVGKYLVLFTVFKIDNGPDICYIYRVHKEGDSYISVILYGGGLNFSTEHPIDAFGVIEGEKLYKVYWIDGINQPRYIIITMPEFKGRAIINGSNYTTLYKGELFNFVCELDLRESVEIKKLRGSGIFSPGVIQYAFTYYNIYGQESNICYTTPLQYISYINRAGSPEDRIACSFKLEIKNPDSKFDYLRVYSIHRTSLDAVPTVKRVTDVNITNIENNTVTVIDSGDIGDTVDPTQLLYIGGREFIPKAFEPKDGTLFFGNYELPTKDKDILGELDKLSEDNIQSDKHTYTRSINYDTSAFYIEEPERLESGYGALFKTNETYRIGIQAQLNNGTWTQPVFVGDKKLSTVYPSVSIEEDTADTLTKRILKYTQSTGILNVPHTIINSLRGKAKRLRACVVFPKTYERDVICQGVIAPTVYNPLARSQNAPFVQSSWFFRPAVVMDPAKFTELKNTTLRNWYGNNIQYNHDKPLGGTYGGDSSDTGTIYEKELMNATRSTPISNVTSPILDSSTFYVDTSIVTFHSPDIEFDYNTWNVDYSGYKLRVVGYTELDSIYGDADITTSTPTMNPNAYGFKQRIAGYNDGVPTRNKNNGGMVARPLYIDGMIDKTDLKPKTDFITSYIVYPWNREGSLNNDIKTDDRTRTAVLKTKVMSNLKFFNKLTPITSLRYKLGISNPPEVALTDTTIDIDTPQLFNSNEVSLLKQEIGFLHVGGSNSALKATYYGNVDTLITSYDEYGVQTSGMNADGTESGTGSSMKPTTKEPVRMKYKSTPHLMFQFKGDKDTQSLMPYHASCIDPGDSISLHNWVVDSNSETNNSITDTFEKNPEYLQDYKVIDVIGVTINERTEDIINYLNQVVYGKTIQTNEVTGQETKSAAYLGIVKWNDETQKYELKKITESGYIKIDTTTSIYVYNDDPIFDIRTFFGDDWESKCIYEDIYDDSNKIIGRKYTLTVVNELVNYPKWDGNTLLPSTSLPAEVSAAVPKKVSARSSSTTTHQYKRYIFGDISTDGSEDNPKEIAPDIAPYLLLVELVKEHSNKFGGDNPSTMQELMWLPASDPIDIEYSTDSSTTDYESIVLKYGDTWFDRYDCLKTYPFTTEDSNQIVEVGSFMCETRVNLNGRWDKNKGELSLINISPTNYNIINPVYSQKDNFFNYQMLDEETNRDNSFYNQITWTKQKLNKDRTDTWTNITLANVCDTDTSLNQICDIIKFNNRLLLFQEKGISTINFNDRVQIPVTEGVPIEISNSYKVDGTTVLSDAIGCQDKWSIVKSPQGIYFADYNTRALYLYNGELNNLSESLGEKTWAFRLNNSKWKPMVSDNNGMRSFYDRNSREVYFTPGPGSDVPALCYSEELKQFVSLFDYNGTQAMFNIDDSFYSLHTSDTLKLWENFKGDYNYIYGNFCPYFISFISNDTPTVNKIFDTVEYQANLFNEYTESLDMPFNKIEVYNDYQEGSTDLNRTNTRKKFRIWRTNIPRSSRVAERADNKVDILRQKLGRARMNNQWLNIKLSHTNKDKYKFVLSSATVGLTYN